LPVFVELGVLGADVSVSVHVEQAEDAAALRNTVGERFNQIPAEPRHAEDGVVADPELQSEPGRHQPEHSLLLAVLLFADVGVVLLKLIELCFDLQLNAVQSVDLLSHNRLLEEGSLLDELINWLLPVPIVYNVVCDHLHSV
jgi:hypothetical protein